MQRQTLVSSSEDQAHGNDEVHEGQKVLRGVEILV
jgi:hypothetical protein